MPPPRTTSMVTASFTVGTLVAALSMWTACCLDGTRSDALERDAPLAAFVLAAMPAEATPLDVRFGDRGEVRLRGVQIAQQSLAPGEPLRVTFYWSVEARLVGGWSVFTHVLDARGERIANGDHAGPLRTPVNGAQRLGPSLWKPGHVYADEISISLPPSIREGRLRLAVGIFRGATRLSAKGPLVDEESRAIVGTVQLGPSPEQVERERLPALVVPRHSGAALVLDGRLDEPAWQRAGVTRAFVEPATGRANPALDPSGGARMFWDDEALYVGFSVASAHLEGRFPREARDPHLWEHECVELMIDPDGDGDGVDYYEVQVSPQNLVFDSRFDTYNQPRGGVDGPFGHEEWSFGGRTAVHLEGTIDDDSDNDKGYTVEIVIPFARLDRARRVPPREGDQWRVNAYVMKHNAGVAWSPILGQGNFHRASRFGRLIFGPPARLAHFASLTFHRAEKVCQIANVEGTVIDHVGPDGVFAHHKNVLIWSWRAAATPLTCQRMRLQLVGLARANPQGAGAITVISTEVGIPPDEIRKLMVKARREAAQYNMCGGAIVYEGDGFRGSVVRGVVTSIMLLATDIYPQSVHGDIDGAVAWLVKRMNKVAPASAELTTAVRRVRSHAGSMPPVG